MTDTAKGRTTDMTVEWAPFRLRPGVGESALLNASQELQAGFLARQPGFIRRELLRRDVTDFVDLVWWESRAAAETAMQQAGKSDPCARYFALMDFDQPAAGANPAGVGVLHLETVATYAQPSGNSWPNP
ncbi:MAG: antibiotic biosynthesis monooxygenase [Rhodospirillaceae bacterium]|nr:antibiotic biosynthesis monooxygenase [Rhodospirillaceae bacterium]